MPISSYADLLTGLAAELEAHPGHRLQLWWSEVGRFVCEQSGSCCRRPWKIHVSREYHARWAAALSELTALPEDQVFSRESEPDELRYAVLAKQADGSTCIMLDEHNLCRIHGRWGLEAKPEVCQRYPHSALQQVPPDYNSVFVAPSCTRGARMLMEPQTLEYRLIETGQPPALRAVALAPGRELSRAAWLRWLGQILDALILAPDFAAWLSAVGADLGRLLRLPAGRIEAAAIGPLEVSTAFAPTTPPELARLLGWLCERFFVSHPEFMPARGWLEQQISDPAQLRLTPAEAGPLEAYLRAYWLRQLLVPSHLLRGELNLLQQMFFTGLQGTLLRLWAHYLRAQAGGLGPNQLAEAANHIYAYVAQAQSPGAVTPWRQLRSELCLLQLMAMGRWHEPAFGMG